MSCIPDAAYITASGLQAAAITVNSEVSAGLAVAAMAAESLLARRIHNLQMDIAEQQLAIAEATHAHAKLFWPAEKAFVDDAFGDAKHVTNYVALPSQFDAIMNETLASSKTIWADEAASICRAPSNCDHVRWDRFAANMRADVRTFGARVSESRTDALNDRRFGRQYAALMLGQDAVVSVASYFELAGATSVSKAQMVAGAIAGGGQAIGFYGARAKPQSNSGRTANQGFKHTIPKQKEIAGPPAPVAIPLPVDLGSDIEHVIDK